MSEYITPEVKIPQRNISQELAQIFKSQSQYAQPYYDLNAKYGPLYNQLDIRNLGQQTLGFNDETGTHVPGTLELGRAASDYGREGDVSLLEQLGPRVTAADLKANPYLSRSLGMLMNAETPSPILTTLNQQAENDLASGGRLSPEADRDIREATRSTWADKGLLNTDQAGIDELFNRENVRAGRIAASRKFAGDVEGLNQTMRDFLGRATQISGTALPDLSAILLGRSGSPGGGGANLTPIGSGTKVFDAFNPYFQDYFSSNQNAAATEAIGNAQNQAATRAAIASIAGGFIGSDIRMKENIRELPNADCRLPNGATVPRYSFTYRAGCVPCGLRGARTYIGVMSDDVEKAMPAAIVVGPHGFKLVNYDMLGIELEEAA